MSLRKFFIPFVLFRDGSQSGTRQGCCVGQYVVQVKEFEQVALPALTLVGGAFDFIVRILILIW